VGLLLRSRSIARIAGRRAAISSSAPFCRRSDSDKAQQIHVRFESFEWNPDKAQLALRFDDSEVFERCWWKKKLSTHGISSSKQMKELA